MMMGPSGSAFVISTPEMSMTVFGNALVGLFASIVLLSRYLALFEGRLNNSQNHYQSQQYPHSLLPHHHIASPSPLNTATSPTLEKPLIVAHMVMADQSPPVQQAPPPPPAATTTITTTTTTTTHRIPKLQHYIIFITFNLFIHSCLSLFKAINDANGRSDRMGYKITSTLYTITAYATPMMLFWAQVTRCTAFIINKRLAKIYFWCVLGTFEFVYLTCFLLVFANKVHVVLDNDPFDYYLSGHVGYEVLTLMQGLVDSLKCFNEILFLVFYIRILQTRGLSLEFKWSHAIYMLIQVILLTSCTIVYLVQMEYGGVISFNWYWMAYTALVLIEMQTFGLQIRQVMNEKLTCLLTDVRSGGGGGGVGSGSPSSCSSGRSSHGLQYSLWASSSSHNNNNNNNPATHNNNTNNYLSNYRRNRRQAAAAVHEQSLIMATPPRNNNKLTSPPPPPTTPPPVFSLLV